MKDKNSAPVEIEEIRANIARYESGDGELILYEGMPDSVMLKLLKSAIKKAKGRKFTVQLLPNWNEQS